MSRDSSVDMTTRLRPRSRGLITNRDKKFFSFQTGSGPTQPRIQYVEGSVYLGVKQQEREAGHSPPSSAEVKSGTSSRLYLFYYYS
jgi:hypothetical protein